MADLRKSEDGNCFFLKFTDTLKSAANFTILSAKLGYIPFETFQEEEYLE